MEKDFGILTLEEKDNLSIKDHFFPKKGPLATLHEQMFLLFPFGRWLGKALWFIDPHLGSIVWTYQSLILSQQTTNTASLPISSEFMGPFIHVKSQFGEQNEAEWLLGKMT